MSTDVTLNSWNSNSPPGVQTAQLGFCACYMASWELTCWRSDWLETGSPLLGAICRFEGRESPWYNSNIYKRLCVRSGYAIYL
jgi:hypothetical protein